MWNAHPYLKHNEVIEYCMYLEHINNFIFVHYAYVIMPRCDTLVAVKLIFKPLKMKKFDWNCF